VHGTCYETESLKHGTFLDICNLTDTPHKIITPTVEQQSNLRYNSGQVYTGPTLATEYQVWNDSLSFCNQLQANITVQI